MEKCSFNAVGHLYRPIREVRYPLLPDCLLRAALLNLWLLLLFFLLFIAERARAILFPLPAAERGGHTRSCSDGVCVCVLLCVSPGARTRCGPFSAIVRLHSAASWLTGSTLINKKKSAPIVELCPLLQVMWLNIEMDFCQYLWIQGYTGYSMPSLLWRGDYHKQIYGCTYECVIWLNNTADFKFKKIPCAVGIRGKQVRLNNLQVNVLL